MTIKKSELIDRIQSTDDFLHELLTWLKYGDTVYKPQGGEAEDRIYLSKERIEDRAQKILRGEV